MAHELIVTRRRVPGTLLLMGILAVSTPAGARTAGRVGTTTYTKHYLHPPPIFERTSLPSFGISACTQDGQGFIWIATESQGLIRWDGYEQRSYRNTPNASVSIPSSYITSLAVAGEFMWIGTGDAGVLRLHLGTEEITHLQPRRDDDTSLSTSGILVVFSSARGDLWVATSDGVLHRHDPDRDGFRKLTTFADMGTDIQTIVEGKGGALWVGTSSEGLFQLDPDSLEVVERYSSQSATNPLSSDTITAVLLDADGTMWVGTADGLDHLDVATGTVTRYRHARGDRTSLADNNVRVLFRDRGGTLWVGTESGLHTMSKGARSFLQYVRDPDDPATTANFPRLISCALQDRGGVLYFADPTSALYRVTPTKRMLSPYYYASQLTELVDVVDGDKPGIMWGSTFAQGLMRYDFNRREISVFPVLGDPASPDSVRLNQWLTAIHRDARGRLWAGGQSSGLIFFDPKTGEYNQYLYDEDDFESISSNDVQDINSGPDGTIWVATFGGGLNRLRPESGAFTEFVSEPDVPASLSSNHLLVLEFDRADPNILWIGTARGGLNRLRVKEEEFTRYQLVPPGGKSSEYDTIFAMYQQDDGVLWLGTDGGGLVRFDPATGDKQYYSRGEGIATPSIYGILPGNKGDLWLSTNGGGLIRFDPSGPGADLFTKADGLAYDVFNQHGYLRTRDGMLVFTAGNGFLRFDPDDVEVDSFRPPVVLTSFKVFNKEVQLDSPIWSGPAIQLDYTDSVISFDFAGLSFAAPEQNRYMYKMDGMHDWIETNRRFVTYSNLKEGDYRFRVKAANHHGMWGEEEAAVSISVAPPPWRTWWAYLIYALCLAGLLWLYLRYQARKVEALKQAHRLQTVEHELALTGAVQTGFLPASNHLFDEDFALVGFYRPADRAGGDWWWYEKSGGVLTVLIGDVTGHGPGPAMVTAAAATAYRIQSDLGGTLEQRLRVLNKEVLRVGGGEYHMTMSAIEIDGRTGRFNYYSAGGQPLLRLPRGGGRTRLLPCPSTPLGTTSFTLGRVEGTMERTERFLLYTDGIPEIALGNGRLLGMRRFATMLKETCDARIDSAVEQVVRWADVLREDRPQDDDWTFALIECPGVRMV